MNMTYRLKGGDIIVTATITPQEFVRELRLGSRFDSGGTDAEYMERFADRLEQLEGYRVRTTTPEEFLDDLIKYGFVRT
ncbi:MAG: hypothetical protein J6W38_04800 [Prevotella sp.]|nr:hypothetical protein [Prevotella sp.]